MWKDEHDALDDEREEHAKSKKSHIIEVDGVKRALSLQVTLNRQAEMSREVQLDVERQKVVRLQATVAELTAKVGRPRVTLQFAIAARREPIFENNTMITFDRESEFLARNGSDRDAHEVFMTFEIGGFVVQSASHMQILGKRETRLEYIVSYKNDGQWFGNLEYRHNLKPLLDAAYKESGCEENNRMLQVPLTIAYKDADGKPFSTLITMSHHPQIYGSPFMHICESKPLE
jgi:hypothetical protein